MTDPVSFPINPHPYNLSLGLGYTHLQAQDTSASYNGLLTQLVMGKNFQLSSSQSLSLNGVFRYNYLENRDSSLSDLQHFFWGVNTEYEIDVAPKVFGIHLDAEVGLSQFLSSSGINRGETFLRPIETGQTISLGLGAGFGFLNDALQFNFLWQFHPGLTLGGINQYDVPVGYSAHSISASVGIDIARLVQNSSSHFPSTSSHEEDPPEDFLQDHEGLGEWFSHVQYPHGLVFSDFGFQPNPSYQQFEGRVFLYKQSSTNSPLGFGLNLALTYTHGLPSGNIPAEKEGFYAEFEEAFLNLRFPWARGSTITAGRFFMADQFLASPSDVFFTTICLQGHESPTNNQVGHSYLFHYAFPLSFGAFAFQSMLDQRTLLTLSSLHDWENLTGDKAGHGALLNVAIHGPSFMSTALSVMGGRENEKGFIALNAQTLMCWPSTQNCALNNNNTKFNLGIEYLFGEQENSIWHAADLMLRYNFNPIVGVSSRVGVFSDSNGARTGTEQTLLETSATLHVHPLSWLSLRAEYRHDENFETRNINNPLLIPSANTLSLGAAVFY